MSMTQAEMCAYIENVIQYMRPDIATDIKRYVWHSVKIFSGSPTFSLRSLERAFDFYLYDRDRWLQLYLNTIELTSDQIAFYELLTRGDMPESQKVAQFIEKTGKSKATYYNWKKKTKHDK